MLKIEDMDMPERIREWIKDKPYTQDDVGMSGNQVLIFEDMVLKIEKRSDYVEKQVRIMKWLEGKLPAPKVLAFEIMEEKSFLLMSRVYGDMACSEYYLEHPKVLLKALAEALKMMWALDIADCPNLRDLETELAEGKYRVENGLVDVEDAEPTTFAEGGFEDPAHLLRWLEENRPVQEPVFSHGDFCLPNVLLTDGKVSGFIDLGDAGVGDKWRDIALCYRSLQHYLDGTFGGKVYEDFYPDLLFEALEIEPDWEKLNYYILLDELF